MIRYGLPTRLPMRGFTNYNIGPFGGRPEGPFFAGDAEELEKVRRLQQESENLVLRKQIQIDNLERQVQNERFACANRDNRQQETIANLGRQIQTDRLTCEKDRITCAERESRQQEAINIERERSNTERKLLEQLQAEKNAIQTGEATSSNKNIYYIAIIVVIFMAVLMFALFNRQ